MSNAILSAKIEHYKFNEGGSMPEADQNAKRIRVLSLDYDGCLAHEEYREQLLEQKLENPIVSSNPKLIEHIQQDGNNYDENIVIVGSNRQSFEMDSQNSNRNQNNSCFIEIPKFAQEIKASFDPYLLADTIGVKEHGASFSQALQQMEGKKQSSKNYHSKTIPDMYKIILLYVQMNKIALQYPNDQIDFCFYDDRGDILQKLFNCFVNKTNFIPANITLKLFRYTGVAAPVRKGFITSVSAAPDLYFEERLRECVALHAKYQWDDSDVDRIIQILAEKIHREILLAYRQKANLSDNEQAALEVLQAVEMFEENNHLTAKIKGEINELIELTTICLEKPTLENVAEYGAFVSNLKLDQFSFGKIAIEAMLAFFGLVFITASVLILIAVDPVGGSCGTLAASIFFASLCSALGAGSLIYGVGGIKDKYDALLPNVCDRFFKQVSGKPQAAGQKDSGEEKEPLFESPSLSNP